MLSNISKVLEAFALDRHHPVGALGLDDPPCRLAGGGERVERAQTAGHRRRLERGVDSSDLPALIVIVEDRDRHAGPGLDPRDRLVLILAGAVGAAKARAVDRDRGADPQARLRPAPQRLLDPHRVGVLQQHPVHGRWGHRFLPAGVRVLPRTDLRQILLRHRLRIACRRHRAVPIRPPRPHDHAPHRGDAVRAPLRAPDVGTRRTLRVHRAQRPRRPAALRRPQRPRRRKRRTIPQPTTGAATQRNPVPILRLSVRIGIAPVGARIARAPAHARPVRRLVQGAAELRRRDPRLRHPQRMAVRSFPIVAETPLHPRPRTRGKTPKRSAPPQNHKPRVVSDQVQPLQRFLAAPAHPTVPRRTAEGARLPARSAHSPPAPRAHGAQTSTRKLLETQIVMTVHHMVPATHLIRPRKTHRHIPERKTLRGRLENIRGAFHDHHGSHAASQTARTNPNHPEPAEPSLPTNLA